MIRRFTLLFVLCHFLAGLNAQDVREKQIDSLEIELVRTTNISKKVQILDALIYNHFSLNNRARMYEVLHELTELSMEHKIQRGIFRSYYYRGLVLFNMEMNLEESSDYFHKALNFANNNAINHPKGYAELFNQLGLLNKNLSRFDSAIYYYEKAKEINDLRGYRNQLVINYINLSKLHDELGKENKAVYYAQKCLSIGETYNDQKAIFHGYRLLAESYIHNHANEAALEYSSKAKSLANKIFGENGSYTHYVNGLLGRIYARLGDHALSSYYNKSNIDYLRSIYGDRHPQLSRPLFMLGVSYMRLGDYDSAQYVLQESLRSAQQIKSSNNVWEMSIHAIQADIHILNNEYDSAMAHVQEVLNNSKANDKSRYALAFRRIGTIKLKTGEYKESLGYFQKAIMYSCVTFNDSSYSANPSIQQFVFVQNGISALMGKAEALFRLAQKEQQGYEFDALEAYKLCDSLVTNFRHHFSNNFDKVSYSESIIQVYQGAVATCKYLYSTTRTKKYIDLAFYFSEKSKSMTLYEVTANRAAIKYGQIPDSVINYELSLKSRLSACHGKLENVRKNDIRIYEKTIDQLFELKREHETLINHLELNYPKYYDLKYDVSVPQLNEIVNDLGKDRTLLEYSVYQDSLYIFVMNSNKNELVSTYKPEIFDQWVDQFKTSIRNQDYETYKRVSYQLYTILIRPVESFLIEERELVIVPDGNLWHINFELLLKEKESSFVFAELPYLINSYAISYSNSASLTLHKNTNGKFSKTECIAFSYSGPNSGKFPNNTDQTTLRNVKLDLPGTREEIKSIASLVAGDYYYGNEANERFFKEYSRNYSLLHLAVHGDIVDEDPMLSKLYFSSLGRDSIEDGLLHVYEIYDMELNADMAVLSACNTGAGVLRKGEGIMSLGRAFQYAGVKSVVLSNWAVPDETAPVIMKYFYTNLKDGQSKSQALRNAKLSYLNDSELYASSPFFWGNFMIVGDASAIDWKESFQYTKLILLITGVVFVAFLFMIEQKR